MNEQDLKYLIASYQRNSSDIFSKTIAQEAKIQQLTDVVELLNKRILELQNEVENLKSEKPKSTRTKKTAPEDGGSF